MSKAQEFTKDDIPTMLELIGKRVSGLRINADQSILAFDHPDGTSTVYETCGDCCSETWFADFVGVHSLIGAKIARAEGSVIDFGHHQDERTRQDYDKLYGMKLVTDKGYLDIVFRNSSNGHYSGWMGLISEGSVFPGEDMISQGSPLQIQSGQSPRLICCGSPVRMKLLSLITTSRMVPPSLKPRHLLHRHCV